MKKQTKRICVRITEDEYKEVRKQREYLDFDNLNSLMRTYIKTALCFRIDYEKFRDVAKEISAVGDKINQIALAVNSTVTVTEEQVEKLKSYMQELDEIMNYDFKEQSRIRVYNAMDNYKN